MAKQKTPHTQTQQNIAPDQSDAEPGVDSQAAAHESVYSNTEGAQTGSNRAFSRVQDEARHPVPTPAVPAYEGNLSTRTPKGSSQGITSRSSTEESERQEKVVTDRPDAQAGVNHSK